MLDRTISCMLSDRFIDNVQVKGTYQLNLLVDCRKIAIKVEEEFKSYGMQIRIKMPNFKSVFAKEPCMLVYSGVKPLNQQDSKQ